MRRRRRRAHTYPLTLAHHVIVPARVAAPVSLEPRHRGERAQEAVTLRAAVVDQLRPGKQELALLCQCELLRHVSSAPGATRRAPRAGGRTQTTPCPPSPTHPSPPGSPSARPHG